VNVFGGFSFNWNHNIKNRIFSPTPAVSHRYKNDYIKHTMKDKPYFLYSGNYANKNRNKSRTENLNRVPDQELDKSKIPTDEPSASPGDFPSLQENHAPTSVKKYNFQVLRNHSVDLKTVQPRGFDQKNNFHTLNTFSEDSGTDSQSAAVGRQLSSKKSSAGHTVGPSGISYGRTTPASYISDYRDVLLQTEYLGQLPLIDQPSTIPRSKASPYLQILRNGRNPQARVVTSAYTGIKTGSFHAVTEFVSVQDKSKSRDSLSGALFENANSFGTERSVRPAVDEESPVESNSMANDKQNITGELWLDTLSFQDWLQDHLTSQNRHMLGFSEGIEMHE
jgi:hypothetical protein